MRSWLRICDPAFHHARRHTDDGRAPWDVVNHGCACADHRPCANGTLGNHVRADAHQRTFAHDDPTTQVSAGRNMRMVADAIVMIDRAARIQNDVGADGARHREV